MAEPEVASRRVAIAGLGLIGGSLARDLSAAGCTVLGFDRDPAITRRAHQAHAIADALDPRAPALEHVDLLVLALPVDVAPDTLARIAPRLPDHAVITDTGSTKTRIHSAADALGLGDRFVGCHPMAGDHRSGWDAARNDLFRDARVWVCRGRARPDAVQVVHELWALVGARPEPIDAWDHDRMLAWTSHLPQALASALAGTLRDGHFPPSLLGPGGRDTARLAASDPDLWTAIALDNADHLADAVEALGTRFDALLAALRADDRGAVRAFFTHGWTWTRDAP